MTRNNHENHIFEIFIFDPKRKKRNNSENFSPNYKSQRRNFGPIFKDKCTKNDMTLIFGPIFEIYTTIYTSIIISSFFKMLLKTF